MRGWFCCFESWSSSDENKRNTSVLSKECMKKPVERGLPRHDDATVSARPRGCDYGRFRFFSRTRVVDAGAKTTVLLAAAGRVSRA